VDKELDAALKRIRRDRSGTDAGGTCLTADVIAAWMDGSLPAHERAVAEAHAADCPRCLDVLAAMARTTPEVPAAGAWWRRPWGVRWVVPAMAAATALVLWIYVGSDAPAPVVQEAAPPERTSTTPSEPASTPQQSGSADGTASGRPEFLPSLPAPPSAERELAKRKAAKEASAPPPPPAPAPAPPPPADEASAVARADVDARLRSTVERERKPSAPGAPVTVVSQSRAVASPAQPRRPAGAAPSGDVLADSATVPGQTGAMDVISPDPSTRWRVAGASIERSTDGGRTWTRQFTAQATLLAGHAPAADVCWIAGQQGVVLVSRDGRTWQRVTSPAAVDLVGITAVDGREATVTAADGRIFHTSDGGGTWSLQVSLLWLPPSSGRLPIA
jgi:hypothetical protein